MISAIRKSCYQVSFKKNNKDDDDKNISKTKVATEAGGVAGGVVTTKSLIKGSSKAVDSIEQTTKVAKQGGKALGAMAKRFESLKGTFIRWIEVAENTKFIGSIIKLASPLFKKVIVGVAGCFAFAGLITDGSNILNTINPQKNNK